MSIAMSLFCRRCSDGHELLLSLSASGRVGTSTQHCSDASIPVLVMNFDVWTSSIDEQYRRMSIWSSIDEQYSTFQTDVFH
jgi:hypothetical protein